MSLLLVATWNSIHSVWRVHWSEVEFLFFAGMVLFSMHVLPLLLVRGFWEFLHFLNLFFIFLIATKLLHGKLPVFCTTFPRPPSRSWYRFMILPLPYISHVSECTCHQICHESTLSVYWGIERSRKSGQLKMVYVARSSTQKYSSHLQRLPSWLGL